jgi:hypothetical protein
MAQVSLLDSGKLSDLLQQALAWREAVASLMVSATNGAVLAYAFREGTPSMKDIRSLSTTTTTAYTVASEEVLVFEAQVSRALSVVTPIADNILLAVQGYGREDGSTNEPVPGTTEQSINTSNGADAVNQSPGHDEPDTQYGRQRPERIRIDLEHVSDELSAALRAEMRGMKWPEDI